MLLQELSETPGISIAPFTDRGLELDRLPKIHVGTDYDRA
jgi:hypothetical protein